MFNNNDYKSNQEFYEVTNPKKKNKDKNNKLIFFIFTLICAIIVGGLSGYFASTLSKSSSNILFPDSNYSTEGLNSTDETLENTVLDCVVAVTGSVSNGFQSGTAAGSGVIISADGYIVTNNHVVEGATNITVTTNANKEYSATVIGTDSKTDIAILKINANDLIAIELGDSSSLQVGQNVFAIGNPLGVYAGTVTKGIISCLDRQIELDGVVMNLLQTDASINSGNSGGALVDSQGKLVGIVVAKSAGTSIEGLGFAIPINDISSVITDIIEKGYASGRASLGVSVEEVTQGSFFNSSTYVKVVSVKSSSAASKGGIKKGDYILAIDSINITTADSLLSALNNYSAGDKVTITILRDNIEKKLTVTLDEYNQ